MNHVKNALKCEESKLTAICDQNDKYKNKAKKYGLNFYNDYKNMITKENLDGVILALPNQLHSQAVRHCADVGLHILVEKPIADNLEDAKKIIKIENENETKILVGHHRRFSNYIRQAKKIISSNQIGQFVGINVMWNTLKPEEYFDKEWRVKEGGGPLNINLIHDIDDLRYIVGDIYSISAESSKKNRGFEVEDSAAILIKFKNGGLGTILLSDCTPSPFYYGAACQEDDKHSPSLQDCYYIFGTEACITMPSLKKFYYNDEERKGWHYSLSRARIEVERNDPLFEELRHFIQVIKENKKPIISPQDATDSLKAIIAVKKAVKEGKRIILEQHSV